MEENVNTENLYNALRAIIVNSLVNDYAVERVAFGFEKPGDSAPIDYYLEQLRLNCPRRRSDICGAYIDEREHIRAEQDRDGFVRDLFIIQMERIFFDAPKNARAERDGEELPLSPRFREYVLGLLPLFAEVLNVEVKYDVFDIMPTDREARVGEYTEWKRFVTSILVKPLRAGRQIDRYVKDFINPPYFIRRLIEKRGKNYYLKPVDIDGGEYAFALFSLMRFVNVENDKILELKMLEWERRHKRE